MNCINSNKLVIALKVLYSFWFRGLRYKGALKSRMKMPTKACGRWRTQMSYGSETSSLRLLSEK